MTKILMIICIVASAISCKSKMKTRELGAYQYKTNVISCTNGTLVVNAFGTGKTEEECLDNAIKTALNDIVFNGLFDGSPQCQQQAITSKPNAQAAMQPFLTTFFAANGEYLKYAKVYNEPISQSRSKKIRKLDRVQNSALEFQLTVDRTGLQKAIQNVQL